MDKNNETNKENGNDNVNGNANGNTNDNLNGNDNGNVSDNVNEKDNESVLNDDIRRPESKGNGSLSRAFIVALALLALAALALFATNFINPKTNEGETNNATTPSSHLILEVSSEELLTINVKSADQEFTLNKDGSTYSVAGLTGFTLDQTKASSLAGGVTYLYGYDVAESASNLADYGLDTPRATVAATYKDGSTKTLLIGSDAPSGSKTYVKFADAPNIYTVYTSSASKYLATLSSLHIIPAWQFAAEDVAAMELVKRDGDTVKVEMGSSTIGISSIILTSPIKYEADATNVSNVYTSAAELAISAYEGDNTEATAAIYGVSEPKYKLMLWNADDDELMSIIIGNDKDDLSTYVSLDGEQVYSVSRASLSFLSHITAAELVDRFANIINITKVDAFRVKVGGSEDVFEITRTPTLNDDGTPKLNAAGDPTYDDSFTVNGEYAEDSPFRKLYQIIIGTRVDGLIPDGKTLPGGEPAVTVTYTLNVDGGRDETIEYVPYDAENYAVRRNGETLFYILKTRVNMIERAIDAYKAGTFVPSEFGV